MENGNRLGSPSQQPQTDGVIQDASAVLAHELRNPLSVMNTAIDLLASEGDYNPETLEILRRQTQHMTHMVSDLLDMTRGKHGKTRLQKQSVQLQSLVESAQHSLALTLTSRRQTLEVSIPDDPIWLDADSIRISQVFLNLLSNASKYSDEGSRIRLVAEVDQTFVEIHVIDQGDGIVAEDLPNIFEFFSQSKKTLDHAQGGLGIGLGLVRNLVEAHGGSVIAHSDGLGKGSVFTVRLPLGSEIASQPSSSAPILPSRGLKVLLVDDGCDGTFLLTALIRRLGDHTIRAAGDGAAALDILAEFQPDVILLDMGLPGMSGLELARRIRMLDQTSDALLVALTGYDDDGLREQVLRAGVDLYRLKPASMEMIVEIFSHSRLSVVVA